MGIVPFKQIEVGLFEGKRYSPSVDNTKTIRLEKKQYASYGGMVGMEYTIIISHENKDVLTVNWRKFKKLIDENSLWVDCQNY